MKKVSVLLSSLSILLFSSIIVNNEAFAQPKLNYSYEEKKVGNNYYETTLYISGTKEELNEIEKVTYQLHPTFTNPIVEKTDKNNLYSIVFNNYGFFTVYAKVKYKNGSTENLSRDMINTLPDKSLNSYINGLTDIIKEEPRNALQKSFHWSFFSGGDLRIPSLVSFFPFSNTQTQSSVLEGYLIGTGIDSFSWINYNGSNEEQRFSLLNFSAYSLSPTSIANLFDTSKNTKFSNLAYFRVGPQFKSTAIKSLPVLNNLVICFDLGIGAILQNKIENNLTKPQLTFGLDFSINMNFI